MKLTHSQLAKFVNIRLEEEGLPTVKSEQIYVDRRNEPLFDTDDPQTMVWIEDYVQGLKTGQRTHDFEAGKTRDLDISYSELAAAREDLAVRVELLTMILTPPQPSIGSDLVKTAKAKVKVNAVAAARLRLSQRQRTAEWLEIIQLTDFLERWHDEIFKKRRDEGWR